MGVQTFIEVLALALILICKSSELMRKATIHSLTVSQ
jgi:hypothetical protein